MRVVTFGESMGLMRGRDVGSFAYSSEAVVDTGGAEGNVAIGLVRLGVDVTWLGHVGDDSLGRRVVGDLRGEGVDVRAIVETDVPTGLMLKETPRSGATTVTYYRAGSAGSRLNPGDIDGLGIESADLIHLTGISLAISQSARDAVGAAVQRARDAGVRVSFDVNHRSRLWERDMAAPAYREIVAEADIVFASDEEAELVLGTEGSTGTLQLAASIAAQGPAEVVLKHGADGASVWVSGTLTQHAAAKIDVIDTVGAGDAFVAGYLSELLAGAAVEQRLRTATSAGAFACRHPGDWQGAATRAELGELGADPVSR